MASFPPRSSDVVCFKKMPRLPFPLQNYNILFSSERNQGIEYTRGLPCYGQYQEHTCNLPKYRVIPTFGTLQEKGVWHKMGKMGSFVYSSFIHTQE